MGNFCLSVPLETISSNPSYASTAPPINSTTISTPKDNKLKTQLTHDIDKPLESPEQRRHDAEIHAKRRDEFFAQSHAAYNNGDGKLAKELSNKGKYEASLMEKANHEAAQLYCKRNNENRTDGMIDLHGLFVKEAIEVVENSIQNLKQQNKSKTLVFIVGMGNHSTDHIPKIKPAVEDLMKKHNFACYVDHPHRGCIEIEIGSEQSGWLTKSSVGSQSAYIIA